MIQLLPTYSLSWNRNTVLLYPRGIYSSKYLILFRYGTFQKSIFFRRLIHSCCVLGAQAAEGRRAVSYASCVRVWGAVQPPPIEGIEYQEQAILNKKFQKSHKINIIQKLFFVAIQRLEQYLFLLKIHQILAKILKINIKNTFNTVFFIHSITIHSEI